MITRTRSNGFVRATGLFLLLLAGCLWAGSGLVHGLLQGRGRTPVRAAGSRAVGVEAPTEFFLPGCHACEQAAPVVDAVEGGDLFFRRVDVSTKKPATAPARPIGDARRAPTDEAYAPTNHRPLIDQCQGSDGRLKRPYLAA